MSKLPYEHRLNQHKSTRIDEQKLKKANTKKNFEINLMIKVLLSQQWKLIWTGSIVYLYVYELPAATFWSVESTFYPLEKKYTNEKHEWANFVYCFDVDVPNIRKYGNCVGKLLAKFMHFKF